MTVATAGTETRLDNGLTVVAERMPDVRSVAVGFWVGTGSRDEESGLAGASHFLEHLLFKGTEERTARAIAEAVDEVGGDMNAFTTKEYTAFYVRVLSDALELGLELLSDIMWRPAFRPAEVEAERRVIVEEILMAGDEPDELVHELLDAALWPEDALGRETLGSEASIAALSRDQIAAFHAHHYRPANVVLAAAGDIDPDALVAAVEQRVSGPGGGTSPLRTPPALPPRPIVVETRATEQAHLCVGFPAFDRDDPDRFALAVLDHVFGGGMSSRLFQEIREERGLAYSVYSYRQLYQGTGMLGVYAGTAPTRAREVLERIMAEVDRLVGAGIGERELAMAKTHLRGSMTLALEDSGARMSRLGRGRLEHGATTSLDLLEARLAAVTLDDVTRVIERVLTAAPTVAALGPLDEAALR